MTAVLEKMQHMLSKLHDVDVGLDVRDYLISKRRRLRMPGALDGIPEQLFVRSYGDDVEVALYVDPDLVRRLNQVDLRHGLRRGALEDFCVALEGVSHFQMVAWRGMHGGQVSALELELQSEVDKFVCAWFLLDPPGHLHAPTGKALWHQIFAAWSLRDDVPASERSRYQAASQAAATYCRGLMQRHMRSPVKNLLGDVRRHYRLGLGEKLAFI
jgi:hypothetical protein